ncbi:MAG: glutaminyl-peptide cyclotransferase [Mangrovibacterium sp.]
MKLIQLWIILLCVFMSIGSSCKSSTKKLRQPVSLIETSSNRIAKGESLKINVTVKLNGGSLQKAELFFRGELLCTSTSESFSCDVPSVNELGVQLLKVVATKDDGQEGTNFKSVLVLPQTPAQMLRVIVKNTYPHNPSFFTEGFEVHEGRFYESTGLNGESGIYEFDLKTGKTIREVPLNKQYFGEGMTILNDKVYQLTYKAQKGFVYNYSNFEEINSFTYRNAEGWGMTNNDTLLIKSDGTEFIDFFHPETFEELRRIVVCDHQGVIKNINELEYDKGFIYANVWMTDLLVKINAQTGEVVAKIDCSSLRNLVGNGNEIDVLNGIAIDNRNGKMYLTGKYWDKTFEVELQPAP